MAKADITIRTRKITRRSPKPQFFENTTSQQREQEIRRQWAEFLEKNLPRIEAALKAEAWIWESDEVEASI